MFGFIVGTLCLVGLVSTVRRRRYGHFMHAYGHGHQAHWGRGGYGYRSGPGWHGGTSGRGMLRGLFAQLDTTPGQEKAIVSAVEKLRERFRGARGGVTEARKELATALGGEVLDRAALEAVMARQDEVLGSLNDGLRETLASVHEALDAEQRRRLAELIADGSLPFGYHRSHGC
jgi:Spy/CpxP family protein refolding chaperone